MKRRLGTTLLSVVAALGLLGGVSVATGADGSVSPLSTGSTGCCKN